MLLRTAGSADAPESAQVFYAAVREGPSPYTDAQRRAWVSKPPFGKMWADRRAKIHVIVAEIDREIVGFISVEAGSYMDLAFTRPEHHGRTCLSGGRLFRYQSRDNRAFRPVSDPRQNGETTDMTPEDIAKLPYRPCVGVMLVNANNEVFVGQRRDSEIAAWQMPQGGIDDGEPARDAALRELREETGVGAELVNAVAESDQWLPYELPIDLVPKLWKGRYRGQMQKWFLLRFNGEDSQINIATEHPEFSEWRWLPARDLVDNIVPFKREVYAAVMAEFSDLI